MRSAAFYLLGKLSSTSLTASAQASICPFRNPPEQMLRATSAWEHLGMKEHAEFRGCVCSVGAGRCRQHFTEPCRASHCARHSRTCGPHVLLTANKDRAHLQEETRPREVKQPGDAQLGATGLGLPAGSQASPGAPISCILDGPTQSPWTC